MKKKSTPLGGRTWAALLIFGLFGQIAWVIENMYFNVFLYNTISGDTAMIAAMVGWSAVTATVTTLVMGALSDKLGKRKAFIVIGYLLWGVSIAVFALVHTPVINYTAAYAAAAHSTAVLAIRSTGLTYEDLGTVKEVPTPGIFLMSAAILLLLFAVIALLGRRKKEAAQ